MIDLTQYVHSVYSSPNLQTKKSAMIELINISHAKKATKAKALSQLSKLRTSTQVDFFATNYMMSGEGLGVK